VHFVWAAAGTDRGVIITVYEPDPESGTIPSAGGKNMTCVICKQGKTAPGTTRMTVERGATVLVFRGVPDQVCDNCGETYWGADAVDRLQEMLAAPAQSGVQVEVREYIAA